MAKKIEDVVRRAADLRQKASELQERARELHAKAAVLIEQAQELELYVAPAKRKSAPKQDVNQLAARIVRESTAPGKG